MKTLYFAEESTDFHKELNAKVKDYFKKNELSILANRKMKVKILIMFIIYILAYTSLFFVKGDIIIMYSIYAFIGGWTVLLGLNIGHDAAHNAIFKSKKANQFLLYIFEIIGTNAYNWVNRHLGAHHVFPNIMDYDSDIQQTKIVKIFPKDKHLKIHSYQHLYMPLVYLLYVSRWIVYRDFKDTWSKKIGVYDNSNYPKSEILKMVFFKLFYLSQMIVIPALVLDLTWSTTIVGFLILTVVGSLVITFVLLSTHVGEDANFPEPDENNRLPHSWSYHQVATAADFGTKSHLLNLLFGGFNHHVIHHLYPSICHIHYPQLTPILIETATKYGYPYRSKKYLFSAIISHFRLLKNNGQNSFLH